MNEPASDLLWDVLRRLDMGHWFLHADFMNEQYFDEDEWIDRNRRFRQDWRIRDGRHDFTKYHWRA